MIRGRVNAQREAVIGVTLVGPGGILVEINAILDTGFTGSLTLPPELIEDLGLKWRMRGKALLANGHSDWFDVYSAVIEWNGTSRIISVEAADSEPLAGMKLLAGNEIHIQAVVGGTVTITPMA